jgi:hypothetical protein
MGVEVRAAEIADPDLVRLLMIRPTIIRSSWTFSPREFFWRQSTWRFLPCTSAAIAPSPGTLRVPGLPVSLAGSRSLRAKACSSITMPSFHRAASPQERLRPRARDQPFRVLVSAVSPAGRLMVMEAQSLEAMEAGSGRIVCIQGDHHQGRHSMPRLLGGGGGQAGKNAAKWRMPKGLPMAANQWSLILASPRTRRPRWLSQSGRLTSDPAQALRLVSPEVAAQRVQQFLQMRGWGPEGIERFQLVPAPESSAGGGRIAA